MGITLVIVRAPQLQRPRVQFAGSEHTTPHFIDACPAVLPLSESLFQHRRACAQHSWFREGGAGARAGVLPLWRALLAAALASRFLRVRSPYRRSRAVAVPSVLRAEACERSHYWATRWDSSHAYGSPISLAPQHRRRFGPQAASRVRHISGRAVQRRCY